MSLQECVHPHSYDTEVQALNRVVQSTRLDLVMVDMYATSALDDLAFHKFSVIVLTWESWALKIRLRLLEFLYIGWGLETNDPFVDRLVKVYLFIKIVFKPSDMNMNLNQVRALELDFSTTILHPTQRSLHSRSVVGFDCARHVSTLGTFCTILYQCLNDTWSGNARRQVRWQVNSKE